MQKTDLSAHTNAPPLRELVAVFADGQSVRDAIDALLAADFDRAELGLVAGEHTMKQSLRDLYVKIADDAGGSEDRQAPVADEHVDGAKDGTARGLFGDLSFVGAIAAGGAAVATAGVLGGAIVTAAAGVAAVGTVGAIMAAVIGQSEADYLEQKLSEGNLILFVRALDPERERKAAEILARHTSLDVKTVIIDSEGNLEPVDE